ncbi:hypothetical protein CMI41_01885 [Candidatus Pacearchaeota archaeon]|nr:hypothetical protein [Candidatus Pacearchaeota archaeon]|tara:strand:- start:403 stop:1254 length:852 start_codon:yes stop_codon:yes gene_type:complete
MKTRIFPNKYADCYDVNKLEKPFLNELYAEADLVEELWFKVKDDTATNEEGLAFLNAVGQLYMTDTLKSIAPSTLKDMDKCSNEKFLLIQCHEYINSIDANAFACGIVIVADALDTLHALENEVGERTYVEKVYFMHLAERDQLQVISNALNCLLGKESEVWDWPEDLKRAFNLFDQEIEPILWKSLHTDRERRASRITWMHPSFRSQYWWWFKGWDLNLDPYQAMHDLAEMMVEFGPGVNEHFTWILATTKMIARNKIKSIAEARSCYYPKTKSSPVEVIEL